MKLIYDKTERLFCVQDCDRPFDLTVKGWIFDKKTKLLRTDMYALASKLAHLIKDDETARTLALKRTEEDLLYALSSATDLPDKFKDIELKCPLGLSYNNYQKVAIVYGLMTRKLLIADEMGTGKTIEAIGIINNLPDLNKILIVCPASLRINWYNELTKWLSSYYDIFVVGPYTKQIPEYSEIIIINYDLLTKHALALHSMEFSLLIADESHYVKNDGAKRSQILLGKMTWPKTEGIKATNKIFLSGTPILNKPSELWTTFSYLYPDTAPTKSGFEDRFGGVKIGKITTKPKNLQELQTIIRSKFMIRRLKKDVLPQLPDKFRMLIDVEDNRALKEERQALKSLRDNFEQKALDLQENKFALFSELAEIRHQTALRKVKPGIERILSAVDNGQKLVVFAHHRDVISEVQKELNKKCIKHVAIHGGTKQADRPKFVDQFQTDSDTMVFIGNISAAGVGLNLTASSNVLFLELDWVYANLEQASDRCHRRGQKNSVLCQYLVIDGSIDAKMAKAVVSKKNIVENSLDNVDKQCNSDGISDLISIDQIFS